MKRNVLTTVEAFAIGKKQAYLKPWCSTYSIEAESMICGSVTSDADNEDLNNNSSDPWNTGQGD